jgi:hypothetical protein
MGLYTQETNRISQTEVYAAEYSKKGINANGFLGRIRGDKVA